MDQNTIVLARKFKEQKVAYEAQKETLEKLGKEWEETENALIAAMIEEGVNSVRLDGLGLFSLRTTNFLSVNAANKPGFFDYLKEVGHDSILKLDVNPRTLTAFLNEHLKELQSKLCNEKGIDDISARNEALEILNKRGASYFTKRDIALKGV